MSDFGERVKSKLSKMTAAQAPAAPSAYDAVLAEFVRRLNEADLNLHAEVEPREPPQRRLIITWPKYRRTNPMILLSFWIDGPRIHVLGEGKRELASVEDLEAFLDNFLDHSHFPETIDAYREIAQQPVQGFLRTRGAFQSAPDDVLVLVSPEQQKNLATKAPGELVIAEVEPKSFPGAGVYDPNTTYLALESAGFAINILNHRRKNDNVNLVAMQGTALRADEPAAAE